MRSGIKFYLTFMIAAFTGTVHSQVSIQNIGFNGNDVSGAGITNATVMNAGSEFSAGFEITIYDAARLQLVNITTARVLIRKGMNNFSRLSLIVQDINYGNTESARFIRTFHKLPSGNYICCMRIANLSDPENADDSEYCDEQSVEHDFAMDLVSPFNEDELDTRYPLLVWRHNEPFTMSSGAEDYRIAVSEVKEGQDAETAILANPVLFTRNNLTSHSIVYPANAPALKSGGTYCWQVTKSISGRIVNQTEVWKFSIAKTVDKEDYKYGELSKTLNASYYTCSNGKVFFRFKEDYSTSGNLDVRIKDQSNAEIQLKARNQESDQLALNYKTMGTNAYEVDVDELHLKRGFYVLEVFNEKKEKFLLKFKVE